MDVIGGQTGSVVGADDGVLDIMPDDPVRECIEYQGVVDAFRLLWGMWR